MNNLYYSRHQLKAFAEDLPRVFVEAGFEIVEEPYIDYGLGGFRATYIRRYVLHQPTTLYDGILTTIIHTVGIPFGNKGQKMVVLSAPRNLKNEPLSETLKLRIYFDDNGLPHVVHNERQVPVRNLAGSKHPNQTKAEAGPSTSQHQSHPCVSQLESQLDGHFDRDHQELLIFKQQNPLFENGFTWVSAESKQFIVDLAQYVAHIIGVISPGLIELPFDMKLEILKNLSVDSIIKMSQVNSEFRALIFKHGESLWRHLCHRDFNIRFINRLVHKTWMELYRDTYLKHQNEICRKERALPGLPERLALPPVPYREQIEWLPEVLQIEWFEPEVLELPFYPLDRELAPPGNLPMLALEFHPLRRAGSLESLP